MKRGAFLKTGGMMAAAAYFRPNVLFFSKKSLGVQLYTVRDLMSAKPEDTLQKIAAIGYIEIEPAGYNKGAFYGIKPDSFKKLIDGLGLKAISGHNGNVSDDFEQALHDAATIGQKYYVIPVPPIPKDVSLKNSGDFFKYMSSLTTDSFKKLAVDLNKYGEMAKKEGLSLCYHNHNFEFKKTADGKKAYDILLEETDPALVNFEMDLYWVTKAGENPLEYFKRCPHRFKLWHVKDMDRKDQSFTEVGNGSIDFHQIFLNARQAGMEHYFVEEDECKRPPLESLAISYGNLLKIVNEV